MYSSYNLALGCDLIKNVSISAHIMVSIQEVKHGVNVCLKALPYVKGDPGVSFKWSRDRGSCNELRLEKVMTEHFTGYYSCEIIKNGEHLFSVHHCLKSISKSKYLHIHTIWNTIAR